MTDRFDERDNVFSRRDYEAGTPEYDDFYTRRPEWRDIDDDIRSREELGLFISPADMGFFRTPAWLMRHIGVPEMVDDEPIDKKWCYQQNAPL